MAISGTKFRGIGGAWATGWTGQWAPGTLTADGAGMDPNPPIPLEDPITRAPFVADVVSQAVQSSLFRDRPAQIIYVRGGEGGIPADPPKPSTTYVLAAPPLSALYRQQAPIVIEGAAPAVEPTPQATVVRAELRRPWLAGSVVTFRAPDTGADASPRPIVVMAESAAAVGRLRQPQPLISRAQDTGADASPRPYVVIAAQIQPIAQVPVVRRGGEDAAAELPARVVVGLASMANLIAATGRMVPLFIRGGVDLTIEPPAPPLPLVGGYDETFGGSRRRKKRKPREPEPSDAEEARTAEFRADVSRVILDAENAQREANRTDAQETLAKLKANLRALRDLN